jgi:hypothetical protein
VGLRGSTFNFLERLDRNYAGFQNNPSGLSPWRQPRKEPVMSKPKILIPFYSRSGTIEGLAKAVEKGQAAKGRRFGCAGSVSSSVPR